MVAHRVGFTDLRKMGNLLTVDYEFLDGCSHRRSSGVKLENVKLSRIIVDAGQYNTIGFRDRVLLMLCCTIFYCFLSETSSFIISKKLSQQTLSFQKSMWGVDNHTHLMY